MDKYILYIHVKPALSVLNFVQLLPTCTVDTVGPIQSFITPESEYMTDIDSTLEDDDDDEGSDNDVVDEEDIYVSPLKEDQTEKDPALMAMIYASSYEEGDSDYASDDVIKDEVLDAHGDSSDELVVSDDTQENINMTSVATSSPFITKSEMYKQALQRIIVNSQGSQ